MSLLGTAFSFLAKMRDGLTMGKNAPIRIKNIG